MTKLTSPSKQEKFLTGQSDCRLMDVQPRDLKQQPHHMPLSLHLGKEREVPSGRRLGATGSASARWQASLCFGVLRDGLDEIVQDVKTKDQKPRLPRRANSADADGAPRPRPVLKPNKSSEYMPQKRVTRRHHTISDRSTHVNRFNVHNTWKDRSKSERPLQAVVERIPHRRQLSASHSGSSDESKRRSRRNNGNRGRLLNSSSNRGTSIRREARMARHGDNAIMKDESSNGQHDEPNSTFLPDKGLVNSRPCKELALRNLSISELRNRLADNSTEKEDEAAQTRGTRRNSKGGLPVKPTYDAGNDDVPPLVTDLNGAVN